MPAAIDQVLAAMLEGGACSMGQVRIIKSAHGFSLRHREDLDKRDLKIFGQPADAIELARFDDRGKYRRLKTAPDLRHGWQLNVPDLSALQRALDYFYPARLAVWLRWKQDQLRPTPLRDTLDRQSGMYRVAAGIADEALDRVVGDFCRSDTGCLRIILWKRDRAGNSPSAKLPGKKFDPKVDQADGDGPFIPLLCQEPCNLLVNECRKAVKKNAE